MKTVIEILIVDDHPAICEGLRAILSIMMKDTVSFRCANNGKQALAILQEQETDLVILDIEMGEFCGLETLEQIQKMKVRPKVMMMSFDTDYHTIQKLLQAGANGYVSKLIKPEELVKGIQTVLEGAQFFGSEISRVLLANAIRPVKMKSQLNLTTRELEILRMICDDCSQEEIATTLNISIRTVEGHAKNLRIKLNARFTPGMIMKAIKSGLVK